MMMNTWVEVDEFSHPFSTSDISPKFIPGDDNGEDGDNDNNGEDEDDDHDDDNDHDDEDGEDDDDLCSGPLAPSPPPLSSPFHQPRLEVVLPPSDATA